MKNFTENSLGEDFAELIRSQSPIQSGLARQSKQQGQTVAVRLERQVPGVPSVVRAIALNPVQAGAKASLIRLAKPVNGAEWGAFSGVISQRKGSNSEVNVSQIPQPSERKKEIKITIKIGYTGKL